MKRTIFVITLIFALLCIISISALAVTSFPMESAVILGDVDRNGKIEKSVDTAAMQSKLLNTTISATEDINADGALLVRFPDGNIREVTAGEVSVRGMYGYN